MSSDGRHGFSLGADKMNVRVIEPGMLTTVQDLGRWGFQSQGVSVAGPMDEMAHRLANALVRNSKSAATLEMTVVGPELEFEDERVVAIGGCEFDVTVDGCPVPDGPSTIPAGSRLKFGARRRGTRAYLAIEGGIAVPPVFGSRATHVASLMGGFEGRALRAGDRLPLGPIHGSVALRESGRRIAEALAQAGQPASGHATVRILLVPPGEHFSDDARQRLVAGPYAIGQKSDRMGFRLEGAPLTVTRAAEIISGSTPIGTVQVLPSGLPILLMADRQTIGGYPTIATVITADLGLAGQLSPGDTISFVTCSRADALAALIARERALLAIERQETT